ncbi:PD-(D/E)XK motif protein [Ralstonia solanacearum]|uniref:PD-(D/E)XK motif protein n=1 Tax=Ralstonia solanacearum TaxID=305 RepID=A0AAD0S457_RALSL|nr:PD-(D/E)XK motif protein [Ralstonia solanacearum]AXV80084.1 PD-(D/E)XK motif protein [Ralstonia solanacearum]AXW51223.1 PD-(D/E)XK motif protein [Ralstonia solanacearum]
MVLPSDQLALAWRSLAASGDTGEGWRSIVISPAGAALVRAGLRFPVGVEAILVRFSAASLPPMVKLPECGGFLIERASLEDGVTWVALTRRETASRDLFATMATDVATALSSCPVSDEAKSLATLLGRVRAWQEFMRRGGEPLSAEAEIGLFGELSLLRALLDEGLDASTACEAWRGPLGGLRDFELGTGGIEVKSTLSSSGFRARVGSLEQLDDTERQPLFLVAVRLRQILSGQSLPDAVEMARDIVAGDSAAERVLAERLVASGYRDQHADSYTRRFEIAQTRVLRVNEGFPRLTPHSVPLGVERASYEIDIDKADAAMLDLPCALAELKGI